jgi:hypothetical protein
MDMANYLASNYSEAQLVALFVLTTTVAIWLWRNV